LACDLKEQAFQTALRIEVDNARSIISRGYPDVSFCGTYGGNVKQYAKWQSHPLSIQSAETFTPEGLKVRFSRCILIQIRLPLKNRFVPRYEIVTTEHYWNPRGEPDFWASRESVILSAKLPVQIRNNQRQNAGVR
jgi:hypothetical protein